MNFEEEMNRFEAEITRNAAAAAAMGMAQHQFMAATNNFIDPGFIPSQIHARAGLPPPPPAHLMANNFMTPSQVQRRPAEASSGPATISAAPKTNIGSGYSTTTNEVSKEDDEDIFSKLAKYEAEHKKEVKKKKKKSKVGSATSSHTTNSESEPIISKTVPPPPTIAPPTPAPPAAAVPVAKPFNLAHAASANTPLSAKIGDETIKKAKKQKRIVRTGGGQVWEDDTLKEWDTNDYRVFCGDLGNDVTDEVLARTFGRYPSFQKAKVIRCKKSNKTKGFGFVSFKDPMDFTKAMKEMNGKYVGSRPIKLRKSNWKERNIDVVRQKQKMKQQMGYKW